MAQYEAHTFVEKPCAYKKHQNATSDTTNSLANSMAPSVAELSSTRADEDAPREIQKPKANVRTELTFFDLIPNRKNVEWTDLSFLLPIL